MIQYLIGDATVPFVDPNEGADTPIVYIVHIVNDIGAWGSGFVVPLGKKYPGAMDLYRQRLMLLGDYQVLQVDHRLNIVNLCAQHKVKPYVDVPVRYGALHFCLEKLAADIAVVSRYNRVVVQMPRMGCDRGGGTWDRVEPLIESTIGQIAEIVVYDLPK